MKELCILDGGMGQELLARSKREVTPLWSADVMLHEPELVRDLHVDFIKSGAQVITMNTYTATPQRLERDGTTEHFVELHEKAGWAALQARSIGGVSNIKIAGCLPPLVASYRPEAVLSFDESLATYRQLAAIQEPFCDLFICETMSSIVEAKAACQAAKEVKKPVWLAFTVKDDASRQLRSSESLADAVSALLALKPDAILLNCSAPEAISLCWPILQSADIPVGAYANGFTSVDTLYPGDTVTKLEKRKDLSPLEYVKHAQKWVQRGASIVGGCCEIGPEHIKALNMSLKAQSSD
jgi:S-methylmethionine-dependent homocysteine/selenocysteine methylase